VRPTVTRPSLAASVEQRGELLARPDVVADARVLAGVTLRPSDWWVANTNGCRTVLGALLRPRRDLRN